MMISAEAASHTVPNKIINVYTWERIDLSKINRGVRKLFYHKAHLLSTGWTAEVDGNKKGETCGWKIYYMDTIVAHGEAGGVMRSKEAAIQWWESLTDTAKIAIRDARTLEGMR